jgi:beta-phosphoglucomutase-like phosphatase (HAD superfamily)
MPTDFAFSAMIFDCDGTLADTASAHLKAFCKALAARGMFMDEKWYLDRVGISGAEMLEAYEKEVVKGTFDKDGVLADHDVVYMRNLSLVQEVKPVVSIARAWKGKIPLSVASGGSRENVQATLESIGLCRLFDHIITREEVTEGKPAPDLFLLAAQKMNVLPSECVVFENSEEGLEGARRAGMRCVDVREMNSR